MSHGGARVGAGRPPLAESDKKGVKVVSLRLTTQEWESLKSEAERKNKPLNTVIKSKLF